MTEKVQIGPLISKEAKEMLDQMRRDDLRALGNWLEVLIRQEHARRQQSNNVVDTKPEYMAELT